MAKRRPQGDGTIRKRSDGRWEARIIVGHKNDGSPMYKSAFTKTQKSALKQLHQLIDLYRDVDLTEDSRMTLGEWLDKWMSEYKQGVIRSSTYASYKSEIENHIKPYLGTKMLTKIKTVDLQKLYNALSVQGLAPATVRGVHILLHAHPLPVLSRKDCCQRIRPKEHLRPKYNARRCEC